MKWLKFEVLGLNHYCCVHVLVCHHMKLFVLFDTFCLFSSSYLLPRHLQHAGDPRSQASRFSSNFDLSRSVFLYIKSALKRDLDPGTLLQESCRSPPELHYVCGYLYKYVRIHCVCVPSYKIRPSSIHAISLLNISSWRDS